MRIALTGATGFTGAFVLPQLLGAGHEVWALARNPEALAGKCKNVVAGDMTDGSALKQLVEGADTVVHMAGALSGNDRASYFDVNLEGTRRLHRLGRAAGAKKFIFVSSITAREPKLSHYAASKAAAENFLLAEDKEALILRPPAIYGPGDRAVLPLIKLMRGRVAIMPGRKTSRFSVLHVADFARVICEAVESERSGIFELDDQSLGYSWDDLAKMHAELTGTPSRVVYVPHGMAHVFAGIAEAYAKVTGGWSMTSRQKMAEVYHDDWVAHGWLWPVARPMQFKDGLAQTLAWYQEQGWLPAQRQKDSSAA